jgi:DNA-binding LacI/PurR family transcriptional regulator
MKTSSPKKHTIEDVAQGLGVSIATVSRAFTGNGRISPATRERVLETASRMGLKRILMRSVMHAKASGHSARLAGTRV